MQNPFEKLGRYKENSPKTGPYSICQTYRDLILKSVAYFNGRYVPNVDKDGNRERLIPERYLEYLRSLL